MLVCAVVVVMGGQDVTTAYYTIHTPHIPHAPLPTSTITTPSSHHIDLHEWIMSGRARPVRVHAMAATGVARAVLGRECEDTISINATWQNLSSGSTGVCLPPSCLGFLFLRL